MNHLRRVRLLIVAAVVLGGLDFGGARARPAASADDPRLLQADGGAVMPHPGAARAAALAGGHRPAPPAADVLTATAAFTDVTTTAFPGGIILPGLDSSSVAWGDYDA